MAPPHQEAPLRRAIAQRGGGGVLTAAASGLLRRGAETGRVPDLLRVACWPRDPDQKTPQPFVGRVDDA